MLVFGTIACVFLPLRMVFYSYFSSHWLGSLGLASLLMFTMIYLSHKQKLGRFGIMFLRQLTKTINGRSGKIAIVFSIVMISYFSSTLIFIDRGNTVYSDEKNLVAHMIFPNRDDGKTTINDMRAIMHIQNNHSLASQTSIQYYEEITSITYAIMNDMMGGWVVNLNIIILVEQIEFLGFIILYKTVFSANKAITVKM